MILSDLHISSRIMGLEMREILRQLPEQDIMIYVCIYVFVPKLREEKTVTLCKAVFSGN